MFTVEDIKKEYPSPKTISDDKGELGDYCIGGAFCMYAHELGYRDRGTREEGAPRFPDNHCLADYIRSVNPVLSFQQAYAFGRCISGLNDDGYFHDSWDMLQKALTYTQDVDQNLEKG